MAVNLIRSSYSLDDLPHRAVIVNVMSETPAQRIGDEWYIIGGAWPYTTATLMRDFPGPWIAAYTGPSPVTFPHPRKVTP